MIRVARFVLVGLSCALLAGCFTGPTFLTESTDPPRARLADTPLPNVPEPHRQDNTKVVINDMGLVVKPVEDVIKGTYTFNVPANVTQVRHQTGKFEQYLLYWGQPQPSDVPFATITVGPNLQATHDQPGSNLKVSASRTYILNGLSAKEWTGYTAEGYPFCELIARHDPKGDMLHVVTIVRTQEIRQVALDTLASITWDENR